MVHLDLGTSAKLAVIWIILKCYYVVGLMLDSIWIVLVFYCKLCAFRIDIFTLVILIFFYLRINKRNTQNNIIVISSFQTGLNDLFTSTSFCFKSKVMEGSHKKKNILGAFSQNLHFWSCDIFFSPSYPINSDFQ